jgi:AcrR family transcriptional regulator
MSPRRSAEATQTTRDSIVARTVLLASSEGLGAVTLGRLAGDLEMSKAGVIGHFGSMQALQLEAVASAVASFRAHVWDRAAPRPAGLARLRAVCDAWLRYLASDGYAGGCLTAAEVGGSPAVRDAVAAAFRLWRRTLAGEARAAIVAGELAPDTDPRDIAFQLNSMALGAAQALRLDLEGGVRARARRGMLGVLDGAASGTRGGPEDGR